MSVKDKKLKNNLQPPRSVSSSLYVYIYESSDPIVFVWVGCLSWIPVLAYTLLSNWTYHFGASQI